MLLTTPIERKCVLKSMDYLQNFGAKVLYTGVDAEGFVNMEELKERMKNVDFISIQHANQEIGNLQDIKI